LFLLKKAMSGGITLKKYNQAIELWQSYKIATSSDLDNYLDSFRILFAYHSGKIENDKITYHDTREIFENGRVSGFTGDPRALFEQANQKICYELLKNKIIAKEPLSISLIKEIHRTLTNGCYDERRYIVNNERPGEFKKHDYVTGINEVGASAKEVENDLIELITEVNAFNGAGDVLKAGTYLHAMFEYIHPFADGNGRVGRALMNYFLMTHDHPPLIVYEENRREYYAALQCYDEAEELDALFDFFRQQTEKTWSKALALHFGIQPDRKGLGNR
jgi:Fic family protein